MSQLDGDTRPGGPATGPIGRGRSSKRTASGTARADRSPASSTRTSPVSQFEPCLLSQLRPIRDGSRPHRVGRSGTRGPRPWSGGLRGAYRWGDGTDARPPPLGPGRRRRRGGGDADAATIRRQRPSADAATSAAPALPAPDARGASVPARADPPSSTAAPSRRPRCADGCVLVGQHGQPLRVHAAVRGARGALHARGSAEGLALVGFPEQRLPPGARVGARRSRRSARSTTASASPWRPRAT